ncbi:PqiC family protein [Ruegeria sp. 2012CJ41-6]|uniref:PqiC family protein n=1 Tax=Ruegeria spongiae TaxID=2942209 RepID=A0ABT0Q2A7_9RHOB|nr:PqiC family protein [Ruegeria spongiae]MCL6283737.1 PqiC family protein [Ruegeria spongiae]
MRIRFSTITLLAMTIALGACGNNSQLYLLPDFPVEKQVRTAARTVEVGTLNLPSYAQDSEINLQNADGVLRPVRNGFWADDPERALTELLASGLDRAISADVAAEPLPATGFADVRVDVKIRRFVGIPGQSMQLSGQYFLTSPNGGSLQRIKRFNFSVPIASDSVNDYALAQSQAIKLLAGDIATSMGKVSSGQI